MCGATGYTGATGTNLLIMLSSDATEDLKYRIVEFVRLNNPATVTDLKNVIGRSSVINRTAHELTLGNDPCLRSEVGPRGSHLHYYLHSYSRPGAAGEGVKPKSAQASDGGRERNRSREADIECFSHRAVQAAVMVTLHAS